MNQRLETRSARGIIVGTFALVIAGCSGNPVADDALLTNNCDIAVLAAVLDDYEIENGMWLRDYAELAPGESLVFTHPTFDGSMVRIDVVLESDHQVSAYVDHRTHDLTTTTGDDGVVLYDVQIEGELCPVP